MPRFAQARGVPNLNRFRFRSRLLCVAALAASACGDDDPPNPNDCPDVVTEELISCVNETYETAGDEGFRLALDPIMDSCVASQPRDLEGLEAACRLRLDIEVDPPVVLRSVAASPELASAVAAAQAGCLADNCQVFSSHFEIEFGERPRALRHDIATEQSLSMLPAPRTWDALARTVTGLPLGRRTVETNITILGSAATVLTDELFSGGAVAPPTAALFSRRVARERTTFDQTVLMVLTPVGPADRIDIIDIQITEPRTGTGSSP